MPFPEGWPPRAPAGYARIRFYRTGMLTAAFLDNAWMFSSEMANMALPYVAPGSTLPVNLSPVIGGGRDPHDAQGGVPVPVPVAVPRAIFIWNDMPVATGSVLQVSFDGAAIHDEIYDNEVRVYEDRRESGIALRFKPTLPIVSFRIIAF